MKEKGLLHLTVAFTLTTNVDVSFMNIKIYFSDLRFHNLDTLRIDLIKYP